MMKIEGDNDLNNRSLSIKWCKYPEKNIENPFMDSRSEIERAA